MAKKKKYEKRVMWDFSPVSRVKQSKKGYKRSENKRIERNGGE